ncbi:Magnesium transporter NIPA [Penicillium italicum]|uniref:Magnesium transporter NIPA n=1 Tax=Penicillium italicum TaxID=40296 RepID=A0A0A2KAV8_PENIT|nr:Magnesium transporter NIPA [Penicillium italicum]
MDPNSALSHANNLLARAESSGRPPVYKAVGISLAVASGVFIGISFVIKKIGLLKANVKYNEEAGEGYGYLKNFWWWTGMTLMIVGELCNFVAYAFVDAILVTPLGALSVVITTILSAIFLKERLSFVGKVGCFCCIIGSVTIAMNAPEQSSVEDIQGMQHFVIQPGFLVYTGVIIVGAAFTALWAGPRYGKSSMFVYISICSMVGGLSVVATQGLGSAILAQINGEEQFKHWFLYVLLVFVVGTLLTEIIYLNKALNLFNAALVTPTYYVMFTSATIITSAILFKGFKGTAIQIATVIIGFMQICAGVVLLQLSKSAKDVPDAAIFKGDLDQIREVAAVQEPESEPKADSIHEPRRFFHDKHEDTLNVPGANEIIEWDGLRRRKTVIGEGPTMTRPITPRTPSVRQQHPPWGMSRLPIDENEEDHPPSTNQTGHSFMGNILSRATSVLHPSQWKAVNTEDEKLSDVNAQSVGMTDLIHQRGNADTEYHGAGMAGGLEAPFNENYPRSDTPRSISWADKKPETLAPEPLASTTRRQFSFNSMIGRTKTDSESSVKPTPGSPRGILRRTHLVADMRKSATEEESLGLVHGDSRHSLPEEEPLNEELDRWSSAESDLGEVQLMFAGRSHGNSVSSNTSAAFPAYEDTHHDYIQSNNPYYLPHNREVTSSPEPLSHEEDSWRHPGSRDSGSRTRARTTSSAHAHSRAPPPAQSSFSTHRHPNPLPPLPDITPTTTLDLMPTATDASNLKSVSSDSDVVTTLFNETGDHNEPPPVPTRQQSGWRRHLSDNSSHDGETYAARGATLGF